MWGFFLLSLLFIRAHRGFIYREIGRFWCSMAGIKKDGLFSVGGGHGVGLLLFLGAFGKGNF